MEMEGSRVDDGRPARRWTREEYDRMAEAGILGPEDNVELIEGEILVMSAEGPLHVAEIGAAAEALRPAFGTSDWIRLGNPFAIDDHSEPEPDLLVVPGSPHDYRTRHPSPDEAALVVEVSHSSLSFDLGRKLRLYARATVPEYWVIDIPHECIHVYRAPLGDGFSSATRHERGSTIKPLRAGGPPVDVSQILG